MSIGKTHLYAAALAFLILLSAARAENATGSVIEEWIVDISLRDDGSARFSIDVFYKEPVMKDDYWIFSKIRNMDVTVDNSPVKCISSEPELGTLITCNDISGKHIRYAFDAVDFVEKLSERYNVIAYTFSITKFTDKFTLTVRLPPGAVLADKAKLQPELRPFEPSFGREGSDGRIIFVKWELFNPRLGEAVNSRIIYEPLIGVIDSSLSEIALIGLIAVAVVMVFGIFWRLRLRTENILPVLNAAERVVVEMLMKQKVIDQRDIVRATDFSKAKVSRLVKSLESRGIVEVTPKGRTKKVKLSLGKRSAPKEEKQEILPEEKALRESLHE